MMMMAMMIMVEVMMIMMNWVIGGLKSGSSKECDEFLGWTNRHNNEVWINLT